MDKVSIIVPAFNVGQYVFRAIESVLNQTYKNVELVIVDDGSSDNTWAIIQQYADSDDRIIPIHQENQGVSVARNTALNAMTGDYFVFLDSDDWLEKDAIEVLMNYQNQHKELLISCSAYYVGIIEDKIHRELQKKTAPTVCVDARDAMGYIGSTKYNLRSSCYKLFNMRLLDGLRFETQIHHGEDGLFVFEYLQKCKGLFFSTDPLWNILERPGSATTSPYNPKWLTAITAAEKMLEYAQDETLQDILILNIIDRTQIVEKEAIKANLYPQDVLYARKKLREYKKVFYSRKRSIKHHLKYVLYTFCPLSMIAKIIALIDAVKKD